MTVIAWDGKTLAADKRACMGSFTYTVTKLYRIGDRIVGFAGSQALAGRLRAWLEAGADPDTYPDNEAEDGCYFIAIRGDGTIERYESTGYPIIVEEKFFACGSGREYAMAAMYLGVDARTAVDIASKFDESCGNGIDTLTHECPGK